MNTMRINLQKARTEAGMAQQQMEVKLMTNKNIEHKQNKTNIINISGIECYEQDGVAYLELEAVARGLGFTTVAASGNEVVRWNTVHKYLSDLSVAASCNGSNYRECCPDFIPENIFYRLAMKAKNEAAEAFQAKVADEIIPNIRKHGMYAVDALLDNPDFAIQTFQRLKEEREKRKALEVENAQQKQMIGGLKPKADYTDRILQNKSLVTITQIAKDYGMTGAAMNELLHKLGVQYKISDQWLLYAKYHDKGYVHSNTVPIDHKDGTTSTKMYTKWTQKGRLFIYNLLKGQDVLPIIERE